MQIRIEFDELTSPRDASFALVGNARGNVEFNNNDEYLKFIAPNFRELKIALRTIEPYIKKESK